MKDKKLWLCHKELVMENGEVDFKKDRVYKEVEMEGYYLALKDEQGHHHAIAESPEDSEWLQYFTLAYFVESENKEKLCVPIGTKFRTQDGETEYTIAKEGKKKATITWPTNSKGVKYTIKEVNEYFENTDWIVIEDKEESTKEWEILEFKRPDETSPYPIWILLEDGKYNTPESKEGLYELNEMLYGDDSVETGDFIIHKIKRLSDNEVFTIGDMITGATYSTPREIQEFILVHGELEIKQKGGYTKIEYVQKAKSVLFTTEDGVDVYEGDKVYTVLKDASRSFIDRIDACGRKSSKLVYFSTREAAEKWIDDNKPIYSKKQIKDALVNNLEIGYEPYGAISKSEYRDRINRFIRKLNL